MVVGTVAVTFFTIGFRSMASAQTKDVPPTHWAYQAVRQLVEWGILEGYPDGTFKGSQPLTRYEFALAVWRVLNKIRVQRVHKVLQVHLGAHQRQRRFRQPWRNIWQLSHLQLSLWM
ncbi:MAG: hypothetical protein GDYSWBUE_001916 [Candidatus Fervidibacterota bacterium]